MKSRRRIRVHLRCLTKESMARDGKCLKHQSERKASVKGSQKRLRRWRQEARNINGPRKRASNPKPTTPMNGDKRALIKGLERKPQLRRRIRWPGSEQATAEVKKERWEGRERQRAGRLAKPIKRELAVYIAEPQPAFASEPSVAGVVVDAAGAPACRGEGGNDLLSSAKDPGIGRRALGPGTTTCSRFPQTITARPAST